MYISFYRRVVKGSLTNSHPMTKAVCSSSHLKEPIDPYTQPNQARTVKNIDGRESVFCDKILTIYSLMYSDIRNVSIFMIYYLS